MDICVRHLIRLRGRAGIYILESLPVVGRTDAADRAAGPRGCSVLRRPAGHQHLLWIIRRLYCTTPYFYPVGMILSC